MNSNRRTAIAGLALIAFLCSLGARPPAALPGRDIHHTSAEGSRSVEAAFQHDSYRPGQTARLLVRTRTSRLAVQVFRSGPERETTRRNDMLKGVPATEPARYSWPRRGPRTLALRIGKWPTGVYFARLESADGRVGFAPFIVRPSRLGQSRVAVVLPTNTWQAYNFRDDDGDGIGDTWYAQRERRTISVVRPFLYRGVPMRFRSYDLPFLHWLAWTNRAVDYLAQRDLERIVEGRRLRRLYDLIVFPGHHEYVTTREYDVVTQYRNAGGNLMFLSANNFFWRVDRHSDKLHKIAMWRDLGRPEAALVGIQYVTYGSELRGPYEVRNAHAAAWLFAGTGLRRGSRFGTFGIEIDRTAAASPRGLRVLAEIRNGHGPGKAGQMTYYETRAGAKVFAAGAFTLAGSATRSYGAKLLDNLWRHMTRG
jgi:hypothetical protein